MESSMIQRYSRHIILPDIGGVGQRRLSASRVLVIGAGGLGSPILLYLAASGVGQIGVIDFDEVSLSNLQRQIIFMSSDVGKGKVETVEDKLRKLNPNTEVKGYAFALSENNVDHIIVNYDLVIDGSDNTKTRYLVNSSCFNLKKPLMSGGINQWDGYLSLHHSNEGLACYECLFPEAKNFTAHENCSHAGVFGPLAGVIGTLMASESIKYLTKAGKALLNEMILYDALTGTMRRIKMRRRNNCKICAAE